MCYFPSLCVLTSVFVYNLDSNPVITRSARRRLPSTSAPFGPKAPINHSLIKFQQTHTTLIGFSYFILQTHVSGEPCKVISSGEPCHLELSRCSGWCLISRNMCCPRFDCHSWPDGHTSGLSHVCSYLWLMLCDFILWRIALVVARFISVTC